MNRNYLPPALKLHNPNNIGQHSPPAVNPATNNSAMLTARRTFGSRACKLPTVQEVGKLSVDLNGNLCPLFSVVLFKFLISALILA